MAEPQHRDVRNHVLFEVATEVANRVGGIYSVLKSKAQVTTAEYGSMYTLLGPLNRASAAVEVEEIEPRDPAMIATIRSMNERGIKTLYGRWLIDGAPRVLLFDTSTGYYKLDEWKGDLWSTAGIPSPPDDHETNEAIVFGYLIAWFLGEVRLAGIHGLILANLFAVRLPRKGAGCHCAVPRVARWCCSSLVQEAQD
jgi:glycogen(starch) synthase